MALLTIEFNSADDLIAKAREIDGWSRIVIFSPYQTDRSFASADPTLSEIAHELVAQSNGQESWHVAVIDAEGRIIIQCPLEWRFSQSLLEPVIVATNE